MTFGDEVFTLQDACAVVLCAGEGKRMKSARPKVLCEVLFKPMIAWIGSALAECGISRLCLVGPPQGGEPIVRAVVEQGGFADNQIYPTVQAERLGTGHAVLQAKHFLESFPGGQCIVLYGDAPFVTPDVIRAAHEQHLREGNAITLVTAVLPDATGYGRIVRGDDGRVLRIVEQADTDERTAAIREMNPGIYWFDIRFLLSALEELTPANAQGEYYLTDVIEIAVHRGLRVGAMASLDPDVALGANDRAGLLRLDEVARQRVLQMHLRNGVELVCTDGVVIGPDVQIGPDTCILPGTMLRGHTTIGTGCTIGPNALLEDCTVGDGTVVNASQVYRSAIGSGVRVGPFAYIRPDCTVADGAKVGDFVELKNSTVGERTSIAHLSYIGDSDLGHGINIGCGTVTVNYDGLAKHRCTIGDDAFIGCNANLIAPVTVHDGAYVAAGSTITDDVPEKALAIARSRQTVKPGWAEGKTKKR